MDALWDHTLYTTNPGDTQGDDFSDAPEALQELRKETIALLMRSIRRPHTVIAKITRRGPEANMVRGYVTWARFLHGASPRQFERMLGMRIGALIDGCMIYYVAGHSIHANNIAPRFFTSWPAGISPRELDSRSRRMRRTIVYHPDYPPASDPIPQFVIHHPVPARLAHVLDRDRRFEHV